MTRADGPGNPVSIRSIRTRLVRTVMWGSAIAVALCFAGIYSGIWLALESGLEMDLVAEAGGLALMTQRVGDQVAVEYDAQGMTLNYRPSARPAYFQIWTFDGKVIARSPSLGQKNLDRPRIDRDDITLAQATLPDGRQGIMSAISWVPRAPKPAPGASRVAESGVEPGVVIAVATGTESIDAALRRLVALLLGGGAILLACLWGIARRGIRRGLGPLDELGRRVTEIEPSRLNARLDPGPLPVELKPIAGRLNDLLGRLEQAFERERRFTANAAHELRTPIAEVRTMAEVAVRYPKPMAANLETLRGIAQVAAQMDRMVSSLLAISRDTFSREQSEVGPCDVAALLAGLLATRAESIARHELGLSATAPTAAPIETDRALLSSALGNLIDNAIEYTEEGGTIRTAVERENGLLRIEIENGPTNLVSHDLPHLFEPFWRKEQTAADGEHAGLGLALVKASIEALGGEVRAELSAEGRRLNAEVVLRIPAPIEPP